MGDTRRSKAQSQSTGIGDQGELWFAAELPRGWVWQPPRRDLGKDGVVVIHDGSDLHNLEFSIQVKTSEEPEVRDGSIIKSGVSRSSVLYWFASPLPTLVVAVDIRKRIGWYAFHLDLFDSPAALLKSESDSVTIRIPKQNRLDSEGWNTIRNRLRQHFGSLRDALNEADSASRLLPVIHSITIAISNLVRLARTAPPGNRPTEKDGISVLIEQLEHRNMLRAVRSLLRHIRPESDAYKQIQSRIDTYEAVALAAYPRLNQLPDDNFGPDLEFAFSPKLMLEYRPRLIDAGLDMVMLLTKRQER